MIKKQLKYLCSIDNCFLFEGVLYELLYKNKKERKQCLKLGIQHKYRFMLNYDDYDYVTDSKLRKKLDRAIAKPKGNLW